MNLMAPHNSPHYQIHIYGKDSIYRRTIVTQATLKSGLHRAIKIMFPELDKAKDYTVVAVTPIAHW